MSLEFSAPPSLSPGGENASPAKKRAAGLREVFMRVFALPPPQLAKVKGNLLIHVPGVATWTLVTSGPRPGLYDFAADEDVHFAMSCSDDLLLRLFTDASELDLPALIAKGQLQLEGNVKVFGRFVELLAAVS